MNTEKYLLTQELKTKSYGYLFLIFLGAHYAYLGNWGKQILYWMTLGGLGIWMLIDLFSMTKIINNHNRPILKQIERIEDLERNVGYGVPLS